MQGAPWLMRFYFHGVHPGFRSLKSEGAPWLITFWMLPGPLSLQLHPRFCSSASRGGGGSGVHPAFCSSTFRMHLVSEA